MQEPGSSRPVARSLAMRFDRALVFALLSAIVGCSTPPLSSGPWPQERSASSLPAPAEGKVLGRSERMVIYQPVEGETLRSIAARLLGSESRDWVIADFNDVAQATAGVPLVVPLATINPVGVYAGQYQTVPILCYHRFGAGGGQMVVSAASFNAQLEWLARNDYRVISLTQLVGFLEGRQSLPRRSVVITIDDGYESVHRIAMPILRKYGFPATLFVYTDFIGANDAMSWPQLRELAASGLVELQAHSKSHRSLIERDPDESDEHYKQMVDSEVRAPREILERRLGIRVRQFAYPYGDANQLVLDSLGRQRYELGLTVTSGGNAFFAQPLMLRRTMIYGNLDLAAFKLKLQTSRPINAP